MSACNGCGFYEPDYEACTCASWEMWYACPIESQKPENKKAMEDYIKQLKEKNNDYDLNSVYGR